MTDVANMTDHELMVREMVADLLASYEPDPFDRDVTAELRTRFGPDAMENSASFFTGGHYASDEIVMMAAMNPLGLKFVMTGDIFDEDGNWKLDRLPKPERTEDYEAQAEVVDYLLQSLYMEYGEAWKLDECRAEIFRRFGPDALGRLVNRLAADRSSGGVDLIVWAACHWDEVKAVLLGTLTVDDFRDTRDEAVTVTPVEELVLIDPRTPLTEEQVADVAAEVAVLQAEEESGIRDEQAIDMDKIVELLKTAYGIADAYVEMTGGNVATIFAGPTREEIDGAYTVTRYTLCAGPGFYQEGDAPSLGWVEEFCWGGDDDDMSDAVYAKDVCDDPTDEVEIARRMAEFIASHTEATAPRGLIAHADVDIALLRQITED